MSSVLTPEVSYLRDLGYLLRENALRVRESVAEATGERQIFERGRLLAYYEVLTIMLQQGNAFGLSPQSLSLDDFDADSLLEGSKT